MIPGITPIAASRAKGPIAVTQVSSSTSTANQTVYTFSSLSLGAESDFPAERAIVVATGGIAVTSGAIASSATIGGVSANKVVEAAETFDNASLWVANVPAGTSGDVVVTFSATMNSPYCVVYRMVGMESIAAHDTASDITVSSNAVSASIDCPADGVIIGTAWFRWGSSASASSASWSNLTEDIDGNIEANARNYSAAHDEFATQQTARVITATGSGSGGNQDGKLALASWSPAPR